MKLFLHIFHMLFWVSVFSHLGCRKVLKKPQDTRPKVVILDAALLLKYTGDGKHLRQKFVALESTYRSHLKSYRTQLYRMYAHYLCRDKTQKWVQFRRKTYRCLGLRATKKTHFRVWTKAGRYNERYAAQILEAERKQLTRIFQEQKKRAYHIMWERIYKVLQRLSKRSTFRIVVDKRNKRRILWSSKKVKTKVLHLDLQDASGAEEVTAIVIHEYNCAFHPAICKKGPPDLPRKSSKESDIWAFEDTESFVLTPSPSK